MSTQRHVRERKKESTLPRVRLREDRRHAINMKLCCPPPPRLTLPTGETSPFHDDAGRRVHSLGLIFQRAVGSSRTKFLPTMRVNYMVSPHVAS